MKMFMSRIDAKVDAKGRVFVPAAFRRELAGETRLVARIDTSGHYLMLMAKEDWEAKISALMQNIDEWDPEEQDALQQLMGETECLETDAQGRILISKRVTEKLGLGTEVTFVGMVDKFAVWDKAQYDKVDSERGQLSLRLKKIKNKNG